MSFSSKCSVLARLAIAPTLTVALMLTLVGTTSPAQARKIDPEFFGMHDKWIRDGYLPTVDVGSVRLWDTGTSWRQIETSKGVFDWAEVDDAVNTALEAGLRPMLVLGQTPQFHASKRTSGYYGVGAPSMPRRLSVWKRYVGKVASRYQDTVDYQVWNEPNVEGFWKGTVSQMAKLTASAHTVINRAVDEGKPTVVAPSFVLRFEGQRTWYKKYWRARVSGRQMAAYTDVVSVNLYPNDNAGPEGSLKQLRYAKSGLPKAARKMPMWNTEINYSFNRRLKASTQAAFASRTLILNAASSIRRMYWYAWAWDMGAVDLVNEQDRTTLKAAGRAWQVTHGWLAGTNMKACRQTRKGGLKGLYTCNSDVSSTERRIYYWKPSGGAVTVRTPRGTRSWTNLQGETTERSGRYRIQVGGSPVMVSAAR